MNPRIKRRISIALLLLCALTVQDTWANATYSYSSSNPSTLVSGFYVAGGTVSVSFTLPTPLAPNATTDIANQITAFALSDGEQTLTEADAFLLGASVTTDGSGDIVNWSIGTLSNQAIGSQVGDPVAFVVSSFYLNSILVESGGQNFPCSFESPDGFCNPNAADAGVVADSMRFGPLPLTDPPASWEVAITARPPAQPVPTSSLMFLALLALAMTFMGGFYLRSFRGSP